MSPTLPVGNIILDDTLMAQWAPYVYWEGMLSPQRWAPWIDVLSSNGYFDQNARVGLVTYDTPMHRRIVEQVVTPALTRAHHAPVDVAYTSEPGSVAGWVRARRNSATSSCASAADRSTT